MYIINSNEELKRKWYKCEYSEGKYIIKNFGLSPIHSDEKYYYFVQNKSFENIISKVPIWVKLWSRIS